MYSINGKPYYKGGLHIHTTKSDGRLTPEEAIALYRKNGFDFIALTDHWRHNEGGEEAGMLVLSGCEYDFSESGIFHILSIGARETPAIVKKVTTAQEAIDAINDADGAAILAHPAWSLNRVSDIMRLHGLAGTEIYNAVSARPWNARPYSGYIVDLLALEGRFMPCLATDDSHFYEGEACSSYSMVHAEACTREAILAAIRAGDFFATQGPVFEWERVENQIVVTCSPVREVAFFTDTVWVSDRVTYHAAGNVTRAAYTIKKTDTFVRVELRDADGKEAWSSPIRVQL